MKMSFFESRRDVKCKVSTRFIERNLILTLLESTNSMLTVAFKTMMQLASIQEPGMDTPSLLE